LGVFFAAWTEFLNIMQSPVLTSIPETRTWDEHKMDS
jgi:hypothetical protein